MSDDKLYNSYLQKRKNILLSYSDIDKSDEEEKEFYETENTPYFARLDLDVEDEKNGIPSYERLYISKEMGEKYAMGCTIDGIYHTAEDLKKIGKQNLIEYKERPVFKQYNNDISLIHWTSPLASLYYDNVHYQAKINNKIYTTMLKRKFCFDLGLEYTNIYIADDTINNKYIDNELKHVIEEKHNGNTFTDIITTISSSQNKIIRTSKAENFVVQGVPGSGKTATMLHRLAYLKYNNLLPDNNRIKIIVPNKYFSESIIPLMNDLKIEEIEQMTMNKYYYLLNTIYLDDYKKYDSLKEDMLLKNDRMSVFRRFKQEFNPQNFIDESSIDNLYKLYDRELYEVIFNEYERIIKGAKAQINELGIDYKSDNATNKDIIEFTLENLNNKLFDLNKQIYDLKKYLEEIEEKTRAVKKEQSKHAGPISSIIYISKNKDEQAKINELDVDKNGKRSQLIECMRELEKIERLHSKYLRVFFSYNIYENILKKCEEYLGYSLSSGEYSKVRLLILLFVNYLHQGKIKDGDEMLVVEDAQEYNSIEYDIIRMCSKSGLVMNLYGDINSSFNPISIKNWEEINYDNSFVIYNLKNSYRNSDEICSFIYDQSGIESSSIGIKGYNPETIGRYEIKKIIDDCIRDEKKVAVIYSKDSPFEPHVKSKYLNYGETKCFKGLEYDTVIVFEEGMDEHEKFLAFSRTLNHLYIIK